jgi:SNF2 family DNA or RNA helicase
MTAVQFTPRPYQDMIVDHILTNPRCAIWAGMGMGKTASTLVALDTLLLAEGGTALVIGPLRVVETTWPSEIDKWIQTTGLRFSVVTGSAAKRVAALSQKVDIHFINYENLQWLVEYWGARWPYKIIVSDESTKLKNFRLRQGGKRSAALAKVAHSAKHFIELTGTPAPKGLIDLWGQMWFMDRGARLGRTFSSFKDRWFRTPPNAFGEEALPHAQGEIQALLRDVCLTIEAKDWFDLKEPIINNIYVKMPARARAAYEEMEKQLFTELSSGERLEAFTAAAKTIKCLQLANGAAYVGDGNKAWELVHDEKIMAVEEVIEEAAGMPVLVAYHFKSDLERLQKAFPKGFALNTTANIERAKRGEGTVWFGHPASMGHGVDGLQYHTNQLVFFGHWWDLEQRLQIIERIGPTRQEQAGMDRPMFIHNIIARDTVDVDVMARNASKKEVQDVLLAAMKRRRKHV